MAPRSQVYQSQLTVPQVDIPRVDRVDVSSGLTQVAVELRQREARQANEAKLEALKGLEELRGQADTLPPDQREAFFKTNAEKIRGDIGKRFGVLEWGAKGMFHEEFDQMYGLQSIDVQASARKGQQERDYAVMEETLSRYEGEASRAETDMQRDYFMGQAGKTIADALMTGSINEIQAGDIGRDFRRKVEKNKVMSLIHDDPTSGLQALESGKFSNLKEEDRISLITRAEQKIQHQVALSDHAAVVNERNRKLMGDQLAKEGFDLLAQGKLTDEWLTQNRAVLDTSDYRMIRQGMKEGGSPGSRAATADLLTKIYAQNADVSEETLSALSRGDIDVATAKSFLDENKSNTPVRRAKSFLTQYLQTDPQDSVAMKARFAEAIAEFDRRFAADPKQDAMDLARTVVRRNSMINYQDMVAVMPLPDHAVGGRNDFDVKATQAATTKAFMLKHNNDRAAVQSDPAFKEEVRKINALAQAKAKFDAAQGATADRKTVK